MIPLQKRGVLKTALCKSAGKGVSSRKKSTESCMRSILLMPLKHSCRGLALIVGVFWVTAFNPVGVPVLGESTHFSDLAEGNAFEPAVHYWLDQGVVSGYPDGTFRPDKNVSRAEALKLILESNGVSTDGAEDSAFSDVPSDAWYARYVNKAQEEAWISGYPDGSFKPEAEVNRVEALKILAEVSHQTLTPSSEMWYQPYLEWGLDQFLILPNVEGSAQANAPMTRAEMAEMLYRFKMAPIASAPEYGVASYYGRSMNGVRTASGKNLDTNGFMTAHKTLPFGTRLLVTNTDTNQSVIVEVVDRGPYGEGRVVDLTPAAFEAIGSLSSGLLRVRVEVLK